MIRTFLCILIIIGAVPSNYVHALPREPSHVLLIYDGLAIGTSREGNIEALQRMLASYRMQVTISTFDAYKKGMLAQYQKVIVVRNLDDATTTSVDYLHDFEAYKGDYLHIGFHVPAQVQSQLNLHTKITNDQFVQLSIGQWKQRSVRVSHIPYIVQANGRHYGGISSEKGDIHAPYGVRENRFAYVPYYERGNLSELAMAYVLKDWLKVTEQGRTYLLIKEIYPFSDLKLVESMADQLYRAGIPFIVSVRPVFSNTDYPAMKRYLETLKYVQSRNGSILVNAPVVTTTINQAGAKLEDQMELFIDVLANYGIAPLGMGAEMYWSYDQYYVNQGMRFFNSTILFPNESIRYKSQQDESQRFSSSAFSMPLSFLEQFEHADKVIARLPMDVALTYDFDETEDQMNEHMQTLMDRWIHFDDYKIDDHEVKTVTNTVLSRNGLLYINDRSVDMNDAYRHINSEYDYLHEQKKSLATLFNIQNKILIALIIATLLVFGLLFIIGYRLYKDKYIKQRKEL
ncbi:hypothetical protein BVG16_09430 [Paenibacillus selenitireducens]|uniref:DUF2334 domain-containing protein n=2 Tax=Paenibacillus selenitireducens TaxID=1324314 RepID=A0A1T2XI68_9BACL|nr:hypothetical protein BVG16_09430 [Paenibacillus selenitireducens]